MDAFLAIFSSASTFVSRGDESGTHVKEKAIWQSAGLNPFDESRYLETSQAQAIIGQFGVDKFGEPLFIPDVDKTDADLGLP